MKLKGLSRAAITFGVMIERASTLRQAPVDPRLKPLHNDSKQAYYHAALAACVAGWDAYINNWVREFYSCIQRPLDPSFHAIVEISQAQTEQHLKKFNTPNWENTRNLLILSTGYDPISDWVWKRRGMGVAQVQEKMNQVLKVRHSFAHGFSIPPYGWTQSPSGRIRLTSKSICDVENFFLHIVRRTDVGLSAHMIKTWSVGFSKI